MKRTPSNGERSNRSGTGRGPDTRTRARTESRGFKSDQTGSSGSGAGSVVALQRAAGNQAVKRGHRDGTLAGGGQSDRDRVERDVVALDGTGKSVREEREIQRRPTPDWTVQPKRSVDSPSGGAEREAERTADAALRTVHRQPAESVVEPDGEGHGSESTGTSPTVDESVEREIGSLRGGGRPLPESVRSFFEPRFGRDFSDVRVHTGSRADAAARSIDAEAFTYGTDVAFRSGAYRPDTQRGKRLIAHELAHVVQQRGGTGVVSRQAAADADAGADLPPVDEPLYRDCTEAIAGVPNPAGKLLIAQRIAIGRIEDAIDTIEGYIKGDTNEDVRKAFGYHFMMPDYGQMQTILDRYREAKDVLEQPNRSPGRLLCNSNDAPQCDPNNGDYEGYAWPGGAYIHVCPNAFEENSRLPLHGTLLHEAIHITGTRYDCYHYQSCYRTQPSANAVDNPDSYTYFAEAVSNVGD